MRNECYLVTSKMVVQISLPQWHYRIFALLEPSNLTSSLGVELLKKTGLTLKMKKCSFFTNTITPIAQGILPTRLETPAHATDDIKESTRPANIIRLRSILGLCNVIPWLVPKSAHRALPEKQGQQKDQQRIFGALTAE